jgi:resuscitation-promoting factor RpfA
VSEIDPKLSRVYREASTEGPPAAIDAAILAAARKQAARPERRARSSWLSWMVPASAIATLVLGVSLAVLVGHEQPETVRNATVRSIAPQPQGAAPASAGESAQAKAAGSPAQAAAEMEAPAAARPAPALAAPVAPATQAFPAQRRAQAPESKAMPESNLARDSALGGAAAPAAPAAAGKLKALRPAQRSPEAWLQEIARLKRAGRDQEAAKQLAEFRKAYPEHPVPEALLK